MDGWSSLRELSDGVSGAVVVGVDGNGTAEHAVRWAAAEAWRRGERLVLVAARLDGGGLDLPERHDPRSAENSESSLRTGMDLACSAAHRERPRLTVGALFVRGSVTGALTEASRYASLVVVGRRREGRPSRVVSGLPAFPTAVQLAGRVECPLATVAQMPPSARDVVVGCDGSPGSDRAVDVAAAWASANGGVLTVLLARDPGGAGQSAGDLLRRVEEAWGIDGAVLRARREHPDLVVRARVVQASTVVTGLREASAGAAVLVIAAPRSRGQAEWSSGSTARALLWAASVPVLVVPPGGRTSVPSQAKSLEVTER